MTLGINSIVQIADKFTVIVDPANGDFVQHSFIDFYNSYDYVRRDPRINGTRMRYNSYVFNQKKTQNAFSGMVNITYEFDEEDKMLQVQLPVHHDTLKNQILETWPSIRPLDFRVSRWGDCQNGYKYDFTTRDRGNLGDFDWQFELDLSGDAAMDDRKINSLRKHHNIYSEGGFYQKLIQGSMIALPKTTPEVVVTVNKQRSGCGNVSPGDATRADFEQSYFHGCEFDYSAAATPVFYPDLNSIVGRDTIVADGIFTIGIQMPDGHAITDAASMTIGGQDCPIINAEDQGDNLFRLTGKFGQVTVGNHSILFNEPSVGSALFDAGWKAEIEVDTFVPSSGSIHGGTEVNVTGKAFDSLTNVRVFDDRECVPIPDTVQYDRMTCVTLPKSDSSRKRRDASGASPSISSISPAKISVLGGDLLTISGSNFGSNNKLNRFIIIIHVLLN